MTTTYRTPEWLGNLEVRLVGGCTDGCSDTVEVAPLEAPDGFTMAVGWKDLTKVEPSLPPEPCIGATVSVEIEYVTLSPSDVVLRRYEGGWTEPGRDADAPGFEYSSWAKVCGYGKPVLLSPAPQPVNLPWVYRDGSGNILGIEPSDRDPDVVVVAIRDAESGREESVHVPSKDLLGVAWTAHNMPPEWEGTKP